MKIETERGAAASERRRGLRARTRRVRFALLAAALLYTAVAVAIGAASSPLFADGDLRGWLQAPGRYLRAVLAARAVDTLAFDIKFKHLHLLHAKREEALRRGLLIASAADFVPGSLRVAGRNVSVRLRLMGPGAEHVVGGVWSLEVATADDGHVQGMRHFALYPPERVGGQRRLLEAVHLRREGLATPRTGWVRVAINGDELGLMLIEELPAPELLDAQERPNSAIVRFDDRSYWEAIRDNGEPGPFDNPYTAPILASPPAREGLDDSTMAVGLLRGFLDGEIPAHEVFDVEQTARFLAVSELWGDPEPVHWTRAHFYYDPLRARLTPIARLGNGPAARSTPYAVERADAPMRARLIAASGSLGARLLADARIRERFVRALERIGDDAEQGDLLAMLATSEAEALGVLHRQAPRAEPIDPDALARRATYLRSVHVSGDAWFEQSLARGDFRYPRVLRADALEDEAGPYLELVNLLPVKVEVATLRHDDGGELGTPITLASRTAFPIELPPTPAGGRPTAVRVRYRSLNAAALKGSVRGIARVAGDQREHAFEARPSAPALAASPVPSATVDEALASHPFLSRVPGELALRAGPGRFEVDGSLIVPVGMSLLIEPGTELVFGARAALVATGSLDLRGTREAPIVLRGAPGKRGPQWQGVALLRAPHPSHWSFVEIHDASGIDSAGWKVPAAVTIRDARIEIESLRLVDSAAERALSLVSSTFSLRDVSIEQSAGTALSLLYADGEAHGLHVLGSGRDGVAATGSQASIRSSRIERVRATAIDVADRSGLAIDGVEITGASVGVAARNGGRAVLERSELRGVIHVPLLAFSDRSEFGGGELIARSNRIEGIGIDRARASVEPVGSVARRDLRAGGLREGAGRAPLPAPRIALAQRGSRAVIDGVAVTPVDAEIGELRFD